MEVEPELIAHAQWVAKKCADIGLTLSQRGSVLRRRRVLLRAINVVVGAVALTVSVIPAVSESFGAKTIRIAGLVAAIVLILDTIIPVVLEEEYPERFYDYAYYIRGFD
ncbi:MAG TPA: hypothetical protein VKL99_07155, partial [Candidatus Angelobacter sp.]|nr:hypothetical protein [Candidatus Angelobacter sp.]